MPIDNPAKLPGAFLFFNIKTAQGYRFAAVAYDENITKTTKLKDLQQRYLSAGGAVLPYMERFAPIPEGSTSIWQGQDNVTYGGVFGGPDPAPPSSTGTAAPAPVPSTNPTAPATPQPHLHRSSISQPWPYSKDEKSPIRYGVYISYWNFATSPAKGIHTSSIHRHFGKGSEVPYMGLYPGNKTNLVPTTAPFVQAVVSEVYLDWYSTFDGDLGWSGETISRD